MSVSALREFTGLAPSVALHIPWDKVDAAGLSRYAGDLGLALALALALALGTVNSNTFQEDAYKFGADTPPAGILHQFGAMRSNRRE